MSHRERRRRLCKGNAALQRKYSNMVLLWCYRPTCQGCHNKTNEDLMKNDLDLFFQRKAMWCFVRSVTKLSDSGKMNN